MKQIQEFLFMAFHMAVAVFAVFCLMTVAFSPFVHAQGPVQTQISELDRRIASMESLQIDHRLTVIETLLTDENNWHRYGLGAISLVLGERVYANVRKRKRDEDATA